MTERTPHPKIKSYTVVELARRCVRENRFDFGFHCHQRMGERGVSHTDIFEVIQRGDFSRDDYQRERVPPWSYVMMKEVDGRHVDVVLHFWKDEKGKPWLVIYTCWAKEGDKDE